MKQALSLLLFAALPAGGLRALDAKDLMLLPIPKEFRAGDGAATLGANRVDAIDGRFEAFIAESLPRSGSDGDRRIAVASTDARDDGEVALAAGPPAEPEGYSLRVSKSGISVRSRTSDGLLHGAATLRQLLRTATVVGDLRTIQALSIRDWPSLRWRGFSDDLTRGPSSTLEYLKAEARLSAEAKMNFMSYYMEHQFAFAKHPEIGPPGGSLTPGELRALVDAAKPLGVDIVGNQQSFGHFYHILKHPKYAPLKEGNDLIRPGLVATYTLLDELYSEEMPALDAKFFNVCCDETWELGKGPTKRLVEKRGVGAVYADHIAELHKLVAGKYGRRMMMWGDIILQHPGELPRLPKDIVMLTWGYDARANFENQIIPFARSGFEFFVCPGVSCWGRLVPDFATAEVNIANFVRDGIKHKALGMLNTTWDDSGENLNGWNGPGILWGAECAWSGDKADPASFDRRAGFLLFGEREGLLARYIAAVKALYRLSGTGGMGDGAFWSFDPVRAVRSFPSERTAVARHLEITRDAVEAAAGLVDRAARRKGDAGALLVAARKLDHIARRRSVLLDLGDGAMAAEKKVAALEALGDDCRAIRDAYGKAWLAECKPYALEPVLKRFDELSARYAGLAVTVREKGAAAFAVVETGARARPAAADPNLGPPADAPWVEDRPQRTAISVKAGGKPRRDLPVEVAWRGGPLGDPVLREGEKTIPVQVIAEGGREVLAFVVPGDIPADGERRLVLYHGPAPAGARPAAPAPAAGEVKVAEEGGGFRIENGPLRLLLKPEGAHIYVWGVRDLGGRDLTLPGETGYAGFLDTGGEDGRSAKYEIGAVARGPVVARFVCRAGEFPEKVISVWSGASWVEVFLDRGVGYFWSFDDVDLAGDGKTPGTCLFSNGWTGKVGPDPGDNRSQRFQEGVTWSAKFRAGDRAIALLTPESPAHHVVGPGAGMGGVGIESSRPVLHFVVYGDRAPDDVRGTMDRLASTLTLLPPPEVRAGPAEKK